MRSNGERRTVLVGLVGRDIGRSRMPAVHQAEGSRLGLRYLYRLIDVDKLAPPAPSLADLVRAAELTGFDGLNITHPYKQAVLELLDEVSPEARAVGAVNTLVFRDGRRIGHNTDHWGFAESFRQELADAPRQAVLQLGAGGAGGAVANALLDNGVARLHLCDRERSRAEALAADLGARLGSGRVAICADPAEVAAHVDGIVNATPVGMDSHPGLPLDEALIAPRHWVADIIYFRAETALLAAARSRGCRTMNGFGMAIGQAVKAFELFSGHVPSPAAMRAAFEAAGEVPAEAAS